MNMNTSKVINVLLAVALVILSIRLAFSPTSIDGAASDTNGQKAISEKTMKETTKDNNSLKGKWKKIDPMDLKENPFQLFNNWMALSVGNQEKMNSMTIGWGALGLLWENKPSITVYVRETHYTRELMDDNEYFTVTAFGDGYKKELMYLGTASGRKEDKMKGSGLTVGFTDNGNPFFEEGKLVLECKKQYGALFDKKGFGELPQKDYSTRPIHYVYVGEIVNAWIKE